MKHIELLIYSEDERSKIEREYDVTESVLNALEKFLDQMQREVKKENIVQKN